MTNERNEAVQAVLDRVTSYQETATDGTLEKELRKALTESDVELDDAEVEALLKAVEDTDGPVTAADVLGD